MQQIDRRQPRVILDQPVTLWGETEAGVNGRIRNLSQGGAFIVDLSTRPPVDSHVHLSFALPHGPDVDADATVLRAVTAGDAEEPEGIAVRFDDDDPGALGAFIRDSLEPAAELGNKVRLKLDTHKEAGAVITARTRGEENGMVTLECDLPFLCIGTGVHLQRTVPGYPVHTGILSWVSAQTPPGNAYPRIHLGIKLYTGREDPTPEQLAIKPRQYTGRQDPTELVVEGPPVLPPLAYRPRRSPLRWLLPALLGGLLVGGGVVAGFHFLTTATTVTEAVATPPPSPHPRPRPVVETTEDATKPAPQPNPEPAPDPPEPAPMTVPLAFAVEKGTASRSRVKRVRRSTGRRTHVAAIRRLLHRARQALRYGKLIQARKHALRVLKLDPSNLPAAALVRELIHRKKKMPAGI